MSRARSGGYFTITPRVQVHCNKLHRLREKKKLSLEKVEAECGLGRSMLTLFERGVANPPLPIVEKLAAFYGVPTASLLTEHSLKTLSSIMKSVSDILNAEVAV